MRIAVASKSAATVDQHFGHAQRFLIYDYTEEIIEQLAAVEVEKYCSYDPDNPFRHRQFGGILSALEGCQAVVTAQIGELPKKELLKAGIVPVSTTAAIADALKMAYTIVNSGILARIKE